MRTIHNNTGQNIYIGSVKLPENDNEQITDVVFAANYEFIIRLQAMGSISIGAHTPDTYVDNVAFTPSTPANWDVPPTDVEEALNELAARVKALEP